MGHEYQTRDLVWRGDWVCLGKRRLKQIVADERWPGMWRVRLPDGTLSDMVNRTRAKDAAQALAVRLLNVMPGGLPAGPDASKPSGATEVTPDHENAPAASVAAK
jgi:hypothetical protein